MKNKEKLQFAMHKEIDKLLKEISQLQKRIKQEMEYCRYKMIDEENDIENKEKEQSKTQN